MITECEISFSDVVLESAKEVFETMIYMNVEETFEQFDPGQDCINASILFKGDLSGGILINCSLHCAKQITANMLAMETGEDIANDDIYDAMNELANLVMGSIKTRLYDTFGDIKVSIPSILNSAQASKENLNAESDSVLLEVDDTELAKITIWHRSRSQSPAAKINIHDLKFNPITRKV